MNAPRSSHSSTASPQYSESATNAKEDNAPAKVTSSEVEYAPPQTKPGTETITIPHTYIFAGETHTSTKIVPNSSPEAAAYLASKDKKSIESTGPTLRRPQARKGLIDPNPTASIKGRPAAVRADLPTSMGGNGARALSTTAKASQWGVNAQGEKAKKLNTVEKSKLDWQQEVERQGLREELEKAEKSGSSYLGRREFLDRVEGGLEEEARRIRMAGKT